MNSDYKEVYFDQYCNICKHQNLKEDEEPCSSCLSESVNLNSHKPVRFEKK